MISFRQLNELDLSWLNEQQLSQLAELIYLTDPFIYPAMFYSKEQAVLVLSKLISNNQDSMFSVHSMYIALEDNCNIIGLILWNRGILVWDSESLIKTAQTYHVALPNSFDTVCREYFAEYSIINSNGPIQIINVCVSEKYRGKRIGKELLKSFCKEHYNSFMELYTLANNLAAIFCYKGVGFKIVQECDGFSLDKDKPHCYRMIKDPIL